MERSKQRLNGKSSLKGQKVQYPGDQVPVYLHCDQDMESTETGLSPHYPSTRAYAQEGL